MEPAPGSSPIVAVVRVMLGSDGAIGVAGPVDDSGWCLKALRWGRVAVLDRMKQLRQAPSSAASRLDLRQPFQPTTDAAERVVVAEVSVSLRADGGIETQGPIDDLQWTLDLLDRGIDAVQNHAVKTAGQLVVPARDVAMPAHRPLADKRRADADERGSRLLGAVPGVEVECSDDDYVDPIEAAMRPPP